MDKAKYLHELEVALIANDYSLEESLACINYASKLIHANLPVIFDKIHLAHLLGIKPYNLSSLLYALDSYCYHEYIIPKKNGGVRIIDSPSMDLKYIQRWILDNIIDKMHVSEYAHGFVKNRSILTNAVLHIDHECVITIDLKDFFPSVKLEQVFMLFKYYGYTKEVSFTLAKLCTYLGILPQGSPASPAITNVLCLKLDKRLGKLAESYNAVYSRYADDLTFSGTKALPSIIPVVKKIIEEEGFRVNEKKTRVAYAHERQEVTGLIVNDGAVKVSKKFKRALRQEIYYCQKYGVSDAQNHCQKDFHYYKEHLYGKAYFVKMIEPLIGDKFLAELDRITWEY